MRSAEDAGFDQFWMYDSHVIWQDCYSVLGWLIGLSRSETMEFGTLVTNPVSRDPTVTASAFATLAEITGARMICGIGRGDSVVRVMKRKPAKLADVEHAVNLIRTLTSGGTMTLEGVDVELDWADAKVPIYRRLRPARAHAGRKGDGVVFQVADPYFIEWGMQFVRKGRQKRPAVTRPRSSFTARPLRTSRTTSTRRASAPVVPCARRKPHRRRPPSP
jgi:alkanesulfonate monooxygenase SsuD/methylene tetrahydromethanopterin reductase-like flavin-dependent oxidoreductase (luciferase family)